MIFVNLDIQIFENLLTRMIENLDIGIFVCELFVMRRSWFVPPPLPPNGSRMNPKGALMGFTTSCIISLMGTQTHTWMS